jgi:hypothetical protein
MSELFLLSERRMARISPFSPRSHGVPRVDDRRVLSGINRGIRPDRVAEAMRAEWDGKFAARPIQGCPACGDPHGRAGPCGTGRSDPPFRAKPQSGAYFRDIPVEPQSRVRGAPTSILR